MSFCGQVDWKRKLSGPVWPFEIIGNASAPAPAPAARNLRRVGLGGADATVVLSAFMGFLLIFGFLSALVTTLLFAGRPSAWAPDRPANPSLGWGQRQ